jgi:hypothetical protein
MQQGWWSPEVACGPDRGGGEDLVLLPKERDGGEPCGEPAISLHSYTVPLVQWSTRLLPVMTVPGSIPMGELM